MHGKLVRLTISIIIIVYNCFYFRPEYILFFIFFVKTVLKLHPKYEILSFERERDESSRQMNNYAKQIKTTTKYVRPSFRSLLSVSLECSFEIKG